MSDEPITEGLERALRERWLLAAAGVAPELPPSVDDGMRNGLAWRARPVRSEAPTDHSIVAVVDRAFRFSGVRRTE